MRQSRARQEMNYLSAWGRWSCISFSLMLFSIPDVHAVAEYSAAAGRVDITPPVGSYMAGYGPDRQATAVQDPLWAKVLFVQQDEQRLVLITLDNIGLTHPDIVKLREEIRTEVSAAHVVVTSTHTHAGPDVVGIWGPRLWRSGRVRPICEILAQALCALSNRCRRA